MKPALRLLVLSSLSAFALGACTQPPAQVMNKGNQFFGRTQYASDMQLRMPQNPTIASKYHDSRPTYEAAAPMDGIVTETLDAPEPVMQAELAPLPETSAPVVASARPTMPQQAPFAVASAPVIESAPIAETSAPLRVSYEPVAAKTQEISSIQPMPQLAVLSSAPMDEVATVIDTPTPRLNPVAQAPKANFIWPVNGNVISRFGPKKNGLVNDGINISAREGEPIWSAAKGEVVYAGNELKGYGNMMIVRHEGGWMTAYAHASDMLVSKGDKVNQGDLIGYVGKTGSVQSAQLHFGIREGKTPVDPETLLPQRVAAAH